MDEEGRSESAGTHGRHIEEDEQMDEHCKLLFAIDRVMTSMVRKPIEWFRKSSPIEWSKVSSPIEWSNKIVDRINKGMTIESND